MDEPEEAICWRLHLSSSPDEVYAMLATDAGRERFWAESSCERDGHIQWRFHDGVTAESEILESVPGTRFALHYFGDSVATFNLALDQAGGTVLTLNDVGVPDEDRIEVSAAWVSVLLALKTALDDSIDVSPTDPDRKWGQSLVDK